MFLCATLIDMIKAGYTLFTSLYPTVAKVVARFNNKAKLWVDGRRDVYGFLEQKLANNTVPVIWFHCASLGEFEQGKPVLEGLKKWYPKHKILITFFSPSGYEIRKNYAGADIICYLPMDSRTNAKRFVEMVKPALVIFVKYEFWYYYLNEINRLQIPLLLLSALFRKKQPFFRWYGNFHRQMLHCFTHIFVQNHESLRLLQSVQIKNASVSGDTRFDRVLETKNNFLPLPLIEQFCGDKKVLVAGSTWTEDDEEMDHFVTHHPDIRFIIVPHDISEERLKECEKLYRQTIRYSQLEKTPLKEGINTLLIDNIGMLSRIYKYATITYIGGAFGGDGIHNILEAAVFAKPVIFGPEHDNFPETDDLIEAGGAFSVENALALETILNKLLTDSAFYANACKASGDFVTTNAGATAQVLAYIQVKRLLTN